MQSQLPASQVSSQALDRKPFFSIHLTTTTKCAIAVPLPLPRPWHRRLRARLFPKTSSPIEPAGNAAFLSLASILFTLFSASQRIKRRMPLTKVRFAQFFVSASSWYRLFDSQHTDLGSIQYCSGCLLFVAESKFSAAAVGPVPHIPPPLLPSTISYLAFCMLFALSIALTLLS